MYATKVAYMNHLWESKLISHTYSCYLGFIVTVIHACGQCGIIVIEERYDEEGLPSKFSTINTFNEYYSLEVMYGFGTPFETSLRDTYFNGTCYGPLNSKAKRNLYAEKLSEGVNAFEAREQMNKK